MKTLFLCLFAGCVASVGWGLRAQTGTPEFDPLGEFAGLPKIVRVQMEFVEMPHETLTKLMTAPREGANDEVLRKEVATLIEKGEASVLETLIGVTRSGNKATFKSVSEFIYPTEYLTEEDSAEAKNPERKLAESPRVYATAFEIRELGSTLEIEPTLGENEQIIDLRFNPEITYHTGNTVWTEQKDDLGDASIKVPEIFTLEMNSSTVLHTGKYQMLGALSPKGEDGSVNMQRKVMVFVRCEVLTVGR